MHDRVRHEMRRVYEESTVPRYLDPVAETLLAEGRAAYRQLHLDQSPFLDRGADTMLFPWAGDCVVNTLALVLEARDLPVDTDGFTLTVHGLTPEQIRTELRSVLAGPRPCPHQLAALVANRRSDKHDWALGNTLLNAAYAARHLDVPGALHTLEHVIHAAPDGTWPGPAQGYVQAPKPPAACQTPIRPLTRDI